MLELNLEEITSAGADTGHGNLLAVQPYMLPEDYASAGRLCEKLSGYLEAARQSGWINARTIAVLPEYIGTWLVAAGENVKVYQADRIESAMRLLALRHISPFLKAFLSSREKDRVTASLFRMRAGQMARDYTQVFSGLARQFGITLVAGSILLPSPRVTDGQVTAGNGPIYNVSAVFKPDGQAHLTLAFKEFPIDSELPFIKPWMPDPGVTAPVFETPAGRLGVLVCADSWYPEAYARLKKGGVEVVAVPSFATGNGQWQIPWGGYNGALTPEDVDPGDAGRLTEGQAWQKYALAGRLAQSGAFAGANVFLHGALWDLGSDSGCSLVMNGTIPTETRAAGAALINLWL